MSNFTLLPLTTNLSQLNFTLRPTLNLKLKYCVAQIALVGGFPSNLIACLR